MAAVATALDVSAECRGAATLDRAHGAPPRGGQRRAMLVTESRAEVTEHIRHFQPLAGHEDRASGGHEVRYRGEDDSREQSSGLAVAHTLLVAIRRYREVVVRLR